MTNTDKLIFRVLVAVGIVITAVFTVWWFFDNHIPANFSGAAHIADYFVFFALSYVVFHDIINQILFWLITSKIKPPHYKDPQKGLKVAFITTFVPASEPLELLHNILPAMVNADYKHDTWLLDEGNNAEAQKICKQYGVKYFTRYGIAKYNQPEGKFAVKTKGGNHNAWYDAHGHNYDIVAQIDTDFVPKFNFLTRTLGFFREPRIAFVGTPQIYGNVKESFIARGAAQQAYSFYGPILRGLAGRKMTLMIGANHVVRVAALKDIGYYNAHLTEDLITGMTIHSQKWESTYVPEVLAVGEGPSTWVAYFNQQMRWAFGCMDILLTHTPKLIRKLKRENAVIYFLLQQHYFTGLAMAVGLFLLLLYTVFGIKPTAMGLGEMVIFYVPLVLCQLLISQWMQKFFIEPKTEGGLLLAGRIISIAVWPVYFLAFVGVLMRKRLVFKVTPKGKNQNNDFPISTFWTQMAVATIVTVALAAAAVTRNDALIMIFWLVVIGAFMYTLILMVLIPKVVLAITSFWSALRGSVGPAVQIGLTVKRSRETFPN